MTEGEEFRDDMKETERSVASEVRFHVGLLFYPNAIESVAVTLHALPGENLPLPVGAKRRLNVKVTIEIEDAAREL